MAKQRTQGASGSPAQVDDVNVLTGFEKFCVFWLALSGWIHFVLESAFVFNNSEIASAKRLPAGLDDYMNLYVNSLPAENGFVMNLGYGFVDFLKAMWKEYSCGDQRYAISDPFIVSVEGLTGVIGGPLCFVLLYAIVYRKPWRYPLQVLLCTMQMYGLSLYFVIEHMMGYVHCTTDSVKCHIFYYWFFNLIWWFAPGVMLAQAFMHIAKTYYRAEHDKIIPSKQPNPVTFFVQIFVYSNVLAACLLGFGLIFGKYLDPNIGKA